MKKRLLAFLLSLLITTTSAGALTVDQAAQLLEKNYIGTLPADISSYPSVEALISALDDPYTRYLDAQAYASFLASMSDVHLIGIGVTVTHIPGEGLLILNIMDHSPAQQAGLTAGELILAVDGHSTVDADSLETASGWLGGAQGSTVTLHVLRKNGSTDSITLTRDIIVIPRTVYQLQDNGILFVTCSSFGEETFGHFADAAEEYPHATGWIVDLRGNTGGIIQDCADTLGIFLDATEVAFLTDKTGQLFSYVPKNTDMHTLYPAIVLTDSSTISAGELFAAAVRDCRGGLTIGQRTFGKGVAQVTLSADSHPEYFTQGDALVISALRFYTPAGATTNQIGVIPDLVVSENLAASVAQLLTPSFPGGDNRAWLRLHLAGWRWYLDLDKACSPEFLPAFTELLEALSPDADLFAGAGQGEWTPVTPKQLAAKYAPEYTPRTFADAESSHYRRAVDELAVAGVIRGTDQGTFNPQGTLTRAQFCALLSQALNLRQTETDTGFSDVASSAWYAGSVAAMVREGLVTGCGDGTFRPDDPLTHEQFAVLMARSAAWLSLIYSDLMEFGINDETALADPILGRYSDWAKPGVWLMGRSMKDYSDGYVSLLHDSLEHIDPQVTTTREEAAESLFRLLSSVGIL